MATIPLSLAWVCVGCELVLDSARICPRCDSALSIASLSKWLQWKGRNPVVAALDQISAVRSAAPAGSGTRDTRAGAGAVDREVAE